MGQCGPSTAPPLPPPDPPLPPPDARYLPASARFRMVSKAIGCGQHVFSFSLQRRNAGTSTRDAGQEMRKSHLQESADLDDEHIIVRVVFSRRQLHEEPGPEPPCQLPCSSDPTPGGSACFGRSHAARTVHTFPSPPPSRIETHRCPGLRMSRAHPSYPAWPSSAPPRLVPLPPPPLPPLPPSPPLPSPPPHCLSNLCPRLSSVCYLKRTRAARATGPRWSDACRQHRQGLLPSFAAAVPLPPQPRPSAARQLAPVGWGQPAASIAADWLACAAAWFATRCQDNSVEQQTDDSTISCRRLGALVKS